MSVSGVSDVVVSDGGPQYTSTSFKRFSDIWQFEHIITSPGNTKANGAAEAAVKSVKKLMKKCIAAHEDPYLGLLNVRNTPVEGINLSPTQLMFGRRTKSTLPTTIQNLAPDSATWKKTKEDKRAKIADRLDQNRRDLTELKIGEAVRLQPLRSGEREWCPATVTRQLNSRDYEVQTAEGRCLRCSRHFVRTTNANSIPKQSEVIIPPSTYRQEEVQVATQDTAITQEESSHDATSVHPPADPVENSEHYRTRTGRVSKPVDRLNL